MPQIGQFVWLLTKDPLLVIRVCIVLLVAVVWLADVVLVPSPSGRAWAVLCRSSRLVFVARVDREDVEGSRYGSGNESRMGRAPPSKLEAQLHEPFVTPPCRKPATAFCACWGYTRGLLTFKPMESLGAWNDDDET